MGRFVGVIEEKSVIIPGK